MEQSTSENSAAPAVANGKLLSKVGEYPASRALVIVMQTYNGKPAGFCTGVLIDKNIGLTAAHCLRGNPKPNGFKIVFGLSQHAPQSRIQIGYKIVGHPEFRDDGAEVQAFDFGGGRVKKYTKGMSNDIAIFSFAGDLPADAKPAQILPQNIDLSNQPIYIYGSGHSQYITGEQYREPKFYHASLFGNLRRGKAVIHNNYIQYPTMYFTAPTSEAHTCMGDSGGPQFLASASFPTVVGINSAMLVDDLDGNNKDSVCGHTALTTKVGAYFDWITQQKIILSSELK